MEKKLTTLRIDADVYKKFSQYAYERGFSVKTFAQRVLSYAVDNDLATTLITSFKAMPSTRERALSTSLPEAVEKQAVKMEIDEITSASIKIDEPKIDEIKKKDIDIDELL